MVIDIDDFKQEIECVYKEERYSVRDNGAVLRHCRDGKKPRLIDNQWTFGKPNDKNYLIIATEMIHRIVATAFHGAPPTEQHIIDHIDTNRHNNRPENLRWFTKLENILRNPVTRKKIEFICGCSAEEFLANPAKYREKFQNSNYAWMRSVSEQEAEVCLKNFQTWAESGNRPSGGSLGEWVFMPDLTQYEQGIEDVFKQVESKSGICRKALCSNNKMRGNYFDARVYATKLLRSKLNLTDYQIGKLIGISSTTVKLYLEVCEDRYSPDYHEVREREFQKRLEIAPESLVQKNWGTKSDFPCCPKNVIDNPIAEYATRLESGAIFFQNTFYFTTVLEKVIIDNGNSLLILYAITKKENDNERWGIMKVTFECGKFVHEIIPNYNGTLEHYWLIDVENHFKSIVEGNEWFPLYDSQGKEFNGDYLPL